MKSLSLVVAFTIASPGSGLLLGSVPGQTQTIPAFEVAQIKPTVVGGGVAGGCHGIDSKFAPADPRSSVPLGRCVITAGRLSHMLSIAFGVPLQRIRGFPDWDGPSRFDLEAEAEDASRATEAQLLSMLRAYLVDQFKLKIRYETEEAPIFVLTVGKNASKLHVSEFMARNPTPELQGTTLLFKGYSMQDFAELLSTLPSVGRPVTDKTGLSGRYDFSLSILSDKPENRGDLKMGLALWQSVFADLQEQLGLKLEAQKGSVESMVIEHAEKPRSN